MVESVVQDRRSLPRVATTLRAKTFPGEADCVMADFNDRGARLRFDGAAPAGSRIIVVVWSTGLAFEANICWRHAGEVGVRFMRRCDFRARAPAEFWAARSVWLASRPKFRRKMLNNADFTLSTERSRADPWRAGASALAAIRRTERERRKG